MEHFLYEQQSLKLNSHSSFGRAWVATSEI